MMVKQASISTNKKIWINKSIWLGLLIMLLLSVTRVPYIGQFFDSVLFGFPFGYAKYLLYSYFILICIFKIFNFKPKAIYQKRFILLVIASTSLLSVCLGGIEILVHTPTPNLLMHYINDIWYEQLWNFDTYFVFGANGFVDGGFIGTLFASIAGAFIILFALILLLFAYFSVFKSHKEFIKIKGLQVFNKLKSKKPKTLKDIQSKPYIETLLDSDRQINLNLEEITTTLINIDHEANLLATFLRDNNISFSKIDKSENELNYWLTIKTSDDQLAKIYELKDSFKLIGLNQEYHLMSTNEIVRIEYPKTKPILNYTLKKFLCTKLSVPLDFPLVVSENHKPVILNLNRDCLFGIFDPKNSSVTNFINCLITTISVHYNSRNFSISYLNPFSEKKNLINTQLCNEHFPQGLLAIKTFFETLEKNIADINQQLHDAQTTSVYELNNKLQSIYKNQVIIIDHIDFIKINDQPLYQKIQSFISNIEQSAISFFCIDRSLDGITADDIQYQIILGFNMDVKLSKKLFDASLGSTLDKQNHAVLCKPHQQLKMKVIIPNISNVELKTLENKFMKI